MKKTTKLNNLATICIVVLFSAIGFYELESIAARSGPSEWLRAKKETAISCSANPSTVEKKFNNEKASGNNSQPEDKNNGNSCPHQWGASGILCNTSNKRNKIHSC
jgi:hypothetical protein